MKGRGRRILVEGVNLGDGESSRCWLWITRHKGEWRVTMRQYRSRKRVWTLDLAEATGVVARRAQVMRCGG